VEVLLRYPVKSTSGKLPDVSRRYGLPIEMMHLNRGILKAGEKSFFIYASEQYLARGNLTKYSIKLCDGQKQQLKVWKLDTKHSQHKHIYLDNSKVPTHIGFTGTIYAIVS